MHPRPQLKNWFPWIRPVRSGFGSELLASSPSIPHTWCTSGKDYWQTVLLLPHQHRCGFQWWHSCHRSGLAATAEKSISRANLHKLPWQYDILLVPVLSVLHRHRFLAAILLLRPVAAWRADKHDRFLWLGSCVYIPAFSLHTADCLQGLLDLIRNPQVLYNFSPCGLIFLT